MNFDGAVIVTVNGHDYRLNFWFMTKSEAVNKMKYAVLSEKIGNMIIKNIFVTVMPNNTPETMTLHQKYCERNKEKFLEKGRR